MITDISRGVSNTSSNQVNNFFVKQNLISTEITKDKSK